MTSDETQALQEKFAGSATLQNTESIGGIAKLGLTWPPQGSFSAKRAGEFFLNSRLIYIIPQCNLCTAPAVCKKIRGAEYLSSHLLLIVFSGTVPSPVVYISQLTREKDLVPQPESLTPIVLLNDE